MNRRDFLKTLSTGAVSAAVLPALDGCVGLDCGTSVPEFARGAQDMGPILGRAEIRRNAKLKGRFCSYFCDDAIWCLRDLMRQCPKSMFDHPFFAVLKECHEKYGLKMQINLFYRTDFFYGMDEFTLKDVTDAYKGEFAANADWLKFGFHSLQEFPDYPWINASYDDVAKCLKAIRGEVARFAGDNMFARALIPHWVPMSKDGVKALADGGIRIMYATAGKRYAYNGDPDVLPYGHSFRLESNRKPETALYTRDAYMASLAASICGYTHIEDEKNERIRKENCYVFDPDTGMAFRDFCTRPMSCINIHSLDQLKVDLNAVKDADFVGYGNHEQYFFKDYLAYQPEYMEKEMLCARTLKERGHRFVFMEDLV